MKFLKGNKAVPKCKQNPQFYYRNYTESSTVYEIYKLKTVL